jgi:histidyl-tRNA synthetase
VIQAPRGTSDILPEDEAYWRFVQDKAAEVAHLYGYRWIETPVFEETALFARGVGADTDIVQKEMYTFEDRGGNNLTLRPEGTAPVCRAYLEHGMQNLPQPVKLFYLGPFYRYERPQAGRYRAFHQLGFEAIGEADAAVDAEMIDLSWRFNQVLGMGQLHLILNSIGCKVCRPPYLAKLREYFSGCQGQLCQDCSGRLERNPLRLLDCKNVNCQKLAAGAPKSVESLCPECAAHFEQLKKHLSALDLPFELNNCLVRGLDYYTRTVFEIQPEIEGSQSTIAAGGRYDYLIEDLGGKPTPALGFATGIERIIGNLKKQNIPVPPVSAPRAYVAYLGEDAQRNAQELAARLRRQGISCLQGLGHKSLKSQLRQANSVGARYAVIIGEEEIRSGQVQLRDMRTSQQGMVPLADLARTLLEH